MNKSFVTKCLLTKEIFRPTCNQLKIEFDLAHHVSFIKTIIFVTPGTFLVTLSDTFSSVHIRFPKPSVHIHILAGSVSSRLKFKLLQVYHFYVFQNVCHRCLLVFDYPLDSLGIFAGV